MRGPIATLTVLLVGAAGPPARAEGTARIDSEIDALWKAGGVTPAAEASDAEFLRRVTLDLAGRIPTPGEATHFLADRSPGKRRALVDRLLASADYAEHWSALYLDLLVGRDIRLQRRFPGVSIDWFEDSLRRGVPVDQMARELISARGSLEQNPAIGYVLGNRLHGGSHEILAGNIARTFLGVQIQCAQCHDHPDDKRWKQSDFAAFAALVAEVRVRGGDRAWRVEDTPLGFAARPAAKLPLRRVAPRFLGRDVPPRPGELRRDTLARAVVTSPLFARATVNWTWFRLFGRGLTDPWDDLGGEDDPRQPALLRGLGADFAAAGFDHRWLLRTIVLSRAYGRSSAGGALSAGARPGALEAVFARAAVRPLTADQLFESQMVASGVERKTGQTVDRPMVEKIKRHALRQYLYAFDDDEGGEADQFTGNIPQALLLRNGDLTNRGVRAQPDMVLGRILAASPDPAQRLEWLFITTYARPPTEAERRRYLPRTSPAAWEDLFHALLTSTEFVTNH